jgi:hypothetical protein
MIVRARHSVGPGSQLDAPRVQVPPRPPLGKPSPADNGQRKEARGVATRPEISR